MSYDTALICLNGHVITDSLQYNPENEIAYCRTCGEPTISQCPSCKVNIRGYHRIPGVTVIGFGMEAPAFCHNCGVAYPWTKKKQDGVNDIINMNRKLSDDEKEQLKMAIDDLVKQTPRVTVAIQVLKSLSKKLGIEGWDMMKPLLGELLREGIKKELGL